MADKGREKRIVVDANIGRSAGGRSEATSAICTDFLLAIEKDDYYQIVMTKFLSDEWDKHQSRFALTWRSHMDSTQRTVRLKDDEVTQPEIRNFIENIVTVSNQKGINTSNMIMISDKQRGAMFKDTHLLEAAIATDNLVASSDKIIRRLFATKCLEHAPVQDIVWIDPTIETEGCIQWLKDSAPSDEHRKLKAYHTPL